MISTPTSIRLFLKLVLVVLLSSGCCKYAEGIDGELSTHHDYPYTASLELDGRHKCNAVIINNFWALTARSCVVDESKEWMQHYKIRTPYHLHDIHDFMPHLEFRSFDKLIKQNNVGVIRVTRAFQFGPKCFPAQIESEVNHLTFAGMPASVSGYGLNHVGPMLFGDKAQLRHAELPIADPMKCNRQYFFMSGVPDNYICAGEWTGNACRHDEGAPLVVNHKLIGIAIHIPEDPQPVVYANMYFFANWTNLRTNVSDYKCYASKV